MSDCFAGVLSSMAKERLEVSAIGEMITLVIKHGAISFTAGEPSTDLLPVEALKKGFSTAFDDPSLLGYYWTPLGNLGLREWTCDWMRSDGLIPDWVNPDNIMTTCGSQEGISLAGEAMIDAGSYVLVESPTYMETLLTFRKQGATCLSVPVDEDGIDIAELERVLSQKQVRFLYTIPNFQNPSGYTATVERRMQVLEVLRKYNVPLLEDDPYHYLSYEGEPPTTYLKLAGDDMRVIYLGSFSKIIAPGMRTGWMVVPDSLMPKIKCLRVSSSLGMSITMQQGLLNTLKATNMKEHIASLCSAYRARRDGMLEALDSTVRELGLEYNRPKGGFFIWGKLDGISDMMDFARYAVCNEKIGVVPGSVFFAPGAEDPTTMRLSFAKVDAKKAAEGAERLAKAIKGYRSK